MSNIQISSSLDCSAIVWKVTSGEPLFHMTHIDGIQKPSKPATVAVSRMVNKNNSVENNPFKSQIKNAQFLFNDKLIVLSHSNNIYLYHYYIHKHEKDEKLLNK
jgi:hypothetical protein